MRVTVEVEQWHFKTSSDDEMIQVRVLIDGKPDLHLTRVWTRDEFHSYFDLMWGFMGTQVKKMAVELDFNTEETKHVD
jgi:hypothetical protein